MLDCINYVSPLITRMKNSMSDCRDEHQTIFWEVNTVFICVQPFGLLQNDVLLIVFNFIILKNESNK